jgi:hypothetical protein
MRKKVKMMVKIDTVFGSQAEEKIFYMLYHFRTITINGAMSEDEPGLSLFIRKCPDTIQIIISYSL